MDNIHNVRFTHLYNIVQHLRKVKVCFIEFYVIFFPVLMVSLCGICDNIYSEQKIIREKEKLHADNICTLQIRK